MAGALGRRPAAGGRIGWSATEAGGGCLRVVGLAGGGGFEPESPSGGRQVVAGPGWRAQSVEQVERGWRTIDDEARLGVMVGWLDGGESVGMVVRGWRRRGAGLGLILAQLSFLETAGRPGDGGGRAEQELRMGLPAEEGIGDRLGFPITVLARGVGRIRIEGRGDLDGMGRRPDGHRW